MAKFPLDLPERCSRTWLLLAATVLISSGCNSAQPTGEVVGEVVYRGKAVTEGEVHFYSKERGIGVHAKIDGSGKFAVPTPMEVGDYAVSVVPPPPSPSDPSKPRPAEKKYADIPMKARDLASSGISKTVKAGRNEFKIELTD